MALLACISAKSVAKDGRKVGDVAAVLPDDYIPTAHEAAIFDFITLPDKREDVEAIAPEVQRVAQDEKGEWKPEEEVREATKDDEKAEELVMKEVWKDKDGSYKEVVVSPRFVLHWDGAKVVDNYSTDSENTKTTLIATDTQK